MGALFFNVQLLRFLGLIEAQGISVVSTISLLFSRNAEYFARVDNGAVNLLGAVILVGDTGCDLCMEQNSED